MRKRTVVIACGSILCLGVGTLAVAMPGVAACALLAAPSFAPLDDGTLVERQSAVQDRADISGLLAAARERIATTFGSLRATPLVAFVHSADAFWPLQLNANASTTFVGSRACIIVGPKGRSVDVLAHELMHAELAERVGYWRRMMEIPTWFDEGIAMQVDFRQRYDLPAWRTAQTGDVRKLATASLFYQGDDVERAQHYAAAKYEVARWLSAAGAPSLYLRLESIRNGEAFDAVLVD